MMSLLKGWRRATRAVAAVEFALSCPILFLGMGVVTDYGLLNLGRIKLAQAVAQGGAQAQLLGTAATPAAIQSFVQTASGLSNVSATATAPACYCITGTPTARQLTSVTPCGSLCPDGVSVSTYYMTVSATYAYQPVMPAFSNLAGATAVSSVTVQLQ